jgi:beta-lactamase class C
VTAAGTNDPVTPATVFRWASLSKGVAADTVALLASEGRLSLEDPVGRWAPSIHLPDGNEHVATVANLLSHTLGLFAHAQDSKLEDGMDPHYLRGTFATLHNICAPGTCHAYQNVAYDAASEIVEQVTGRPYHEVVETRLFQPLGMTHASYGRDALMGAPSWARGHAGGRDSRPIEISDAYYRVPAAGGVNGTIGDLAIWMIAQMGLAPDVLPRAALAAVQTPRIATPGENRRRRRFAERTASSSYGLGWRILDYAGHRVIGHHGGVRGYRSMLMFDPATRTGIVALWNSSAVKPEGIEYEVMDMAYRLPFRDWMEIDERSRDAHPEPANNEGGNG